MGKAISGFLIVAAIIHLVPAAGVIGGDRLSAMYGIAFQEVDMLILMQHRAVLFGLLSALLFYAAFKPSLQLVALVAGIISVASFIVLALLAGNYNPSLNRVVIADVVALVCLLAAAVLYIIRQRQA